MDMDNLFDKVGFEVGDIVINKNKHIDNKPHTIKDVTTVTNKDGFSYMVLFFEDDNTFHVAYEYEPFDKDERKQYYNIWNRKATKIKSKPSRNSNKKSKPLTFNLNKIKNDKK